MTMSPVEPPLAARDAYRLWAPAYEGETAVSALETRAVAEVSPPVAGLALLDAGCGTGRRLRDAAGDARLAVGVDLVPEMLAAGSPGPPRVAGDVRRLPFRAGLFDLVWCRLVLGHLPALGPAYAELGRLARPGARLIVSDFHPAAAAAGHRRTFRDGEGRVREVVHNVHTLADHRRAAAGAGWTLEEARDVTPGPGERPFYERAGRAADYERQRSLPLVLVLRLVC